MAEQKKPVWAKPYVWVALGVALGLLVFLLTSNTNRQPVASGAPAALAPQPVAEGGEALAIQRARNQALQEEVERLEKALLEDPCKVLRMLEEEDPRNTSLNPGVLPKPESGPSGAAPNPSEALPPITPPKPPSNVGELLEQSTVFILTLQPDGKAGAGSGFFVAPGVVVTNAHVVGGDAAKIIVGNQAMGGMRPGQLAALSKEQGYDFAIIKVPGTQSLPYLRITGGAKRTDRISAWGFPFFITGDDPKLQALIKGDMSAAPEVVYSEGVVSVVLERQPPIIVHTASLSQGNSGGPLINDAGVVVGINTLITKASESYSQSSVALPGKDLAAFMKAHGVEATPSDK